MLFRGLRHLFARANPFVEDDVGFVKLTQSSLKPFTGAPKDWTRFKMMALNTFTAAGYDKILADDVYAETHPRKNQIVFAQLATATMDGTARHLVNAFMPTQDGHQAWQSLLNRFDGAHMQHATAEQTRSILYSTYLYTGNNCDAYIDKFLHLHSLLQQIEGESMSEHAAIALFHRNNHDVDFKQTIETLQTQDLETLDEHIEKIRKKSITMEQARAHRRKMTKHVRRMNHSGTGVYSDSEDETSHRSPPPSKRQRIRRTRRLEGTIETMDSGLISIPSPEWKKLTPDDMTFVQKYNSKVKHREDPSGIVPPEGVKIQIRSIARRTGTNQIPDDDIQDIEPDPNTRKHGEEKGISFGMRHGGRTPTSGGS